MIEKDPKTGLWRHPQPVSRDSLNNTDELIDNFVAECERQAAKVTKEKCDELLVQYINGGQNPNRLRAVAVQDV